MNKQKVQQILQIEASAQEIHNTAQQEAKKLVLDAQAEVDKLREQMYLDVKHETEKILNQAQSTEKRSRILNQSKRDVEKKEQLAKQNFDKAVRFVLDQIAKQD